MPANNNNSIRFSSLFTPSHIICQTEETNRDKVIMELLRLLAYERGIGNVDEAYDSILKRENEIPTVVGPHIAMPHARLEALDSLVVGVATSQKGIVYTPANDNPVKLLILTLAPKTAPGAYLQAISSVAKICQDPKTADVVSELSTDKEVWRFFDRGGITLPDHLLARHIMDPVEVQLLENDTLERAIDLFVRDKLRELPVVDKDDNLIGVVTTYELLRVCLPDYILWMDDLSPIMNFEPFAEVLRKEGKTWLAEIMTSDYAVVKEDAPAIQVAKEITRQRAGNAYVIRGKKLVGVVSLVSFLNKVMRE